MYPSRSPGRATLTRERRGSIIVWVGVMVIAMVAFGAMAVDYGSFYVSANEQQTVVDASALAGARRLQLAKPSDDKDAVVFEAARSIAQMNPLMGQAASLAAGNVRLVYWNEAASEVEALNGRPANAVQVVDTAQTSFIFGHVFNNRYGLAAPAIEQGAVAWTASISGLSCIKPIGFNMELIYKMLGDPIVDGPMTQAQVDRFNNLTPAQRTFVSWPAPNGNGTQQPVPITGWPEYAALALTGQGGGVPEYQNYLGGGCLIGSTLDVNETYDQPSGVQPRQTIEIFTGTAQGQARDIPPLCHFSGNTNQTCYKPGTQVTGSGASPGTPGITFPTAFGVPPGKFGRQNYRVDMLADVTIMCVVRGQPGNGTGSGGPQSGATCNSGTSNTTFNNVSAYSQGTIVGIIHANLGFKGPGQIVYSSVPSITQRLFLVK
jgi:Flp pilus assembly protein TadG